VRDVIHRRGLEAALFEEGERRALDRTVRGDGGPAR